MRYLLVGFAVLIVGDTAMTRAAFRRGERFVSDLAASEGKLQGRGENSGPAREPGWSGGRGVEPWPTRIGMRATHLAEMTIARAVQKRLNSMQRSIVRR